MREYRELLAVIILVSFILFLAEGWRKYEKLQDEAIERGHAVMYEGEFRWQKCKMKGITR